MVESSVLVVEDEGIVARDIQYRLERFGYSVPALASSAGEAISMAESSHPDIVLMDVVLQGPRDGIEAAEQIRERFDIPVVFLSAYSDEHTLKRARRSEPYGYLLKPFNETELRTTIEVALFKHRVERKLRESEAQYRLLVESAPDAIISLSPGSVILSLNRAFELLTGWDRAEWTGRNVIDLVHPDDLASARELFIRSPDSPNTATRELRLRKRTGEYVFWEITAASRIENGRTSSVLGIGRDIAERRSLEEQVRQSQKMDMIGVLAGGLAHDFNNLLSIIMGHVSLLDRFGSNPEKRVQSLTRIQQASERGATLVRQLLTVARKTETVRSPVDLNGIVREILTLVSETFPRTITISSRLASGLPPMMGDANQVYQVALNLCVNARDAMPRGGALTVATSVAGREDLVARFPEATADRYLVLTVADTGRGMDEETRSRIYEPFFTTKVQGVGLGLSVVYGIVKSHSGFIDVTSIPDKGSVFDAFFPVMRQEERRGPQGGTHPRVVERKETILLVEDEDALRDLMVEALSSTGFSVVTARDGEQAVEVFSHTREHIDLVFSDIGLPKMRGEEMLGRIREIDPKVPIVFSSGYLDAQTKSALLRQGANDFIQKPHNVQTALVKIREILDRGQP